MREERVIGDVESPSISEMDTSSLALDVDFIKDMANEGNASESISRRLVSYSSNFYLSVGFMDLLEKKVENKLEFCIE